MQTLRHKLAFKWKTSLYAQHTIETGEQKTVLDYPIHQQHLLIWVRLYCGGELKDSQLVG